MTPSRAETAAKLRSLAAEILATANQIDPIDINVDESGSPGAALIATERVRQITEEGHTTAKDRTHTGQELALGAFCYLERAAQDKLPQDDKSIPHIWPWNRSDWRPKDTRVRNLVVAGALVAAEIDRLYATGLR